MQCFRQWHGRPPSTTMTTLWLPWGWAWRLQNNLSVCVCQCGGSHNQTLWASEEQGICSLGIACWQWWPLGTRPRPLLHAGNHITSVLSWYNRDSALYGFNASVKIWKGLYFVFIVLTKLFPKGSRDSQMINTNKSMLLSLFFFFSQVNWKRILFSYIERQQNMQQRLKDQQSWQNMIDAKHSGYGQNKKH